MIDPQALLSSLSSFDAAAVVKTLVLSATTYLSVWGVRRGIVRLQRGKRLGPALQTTATKKPGPILNWLKLPVFAEKAAVKLVDIGAYAVFAYVTYTAALNLHLPFQPWSPMVFSALACLNLWGYLRSQSGRCVVFHNGLLLEGAFFKEKHILAYDVGKDYVEIETKRKLYRLSGRNVARFKAITNDIELKLRISAREQPSR